MTKRMRIRSTSLAEASCSTLFLVDDEITSHIRCSAHVSSLKVTCTGRDCPVADLNTVNVMPTD
jgi:hypothetical protein